MRKIYILFLFACFALTLSAQSERSAIRYLKKADKALAKQTHLNYKAKVFFKESLVLDTFYAQGNVTLLRNPRDRFFGYDLYISTDVLSNFYRQSRYYALDNGKKKMYPGQYLDPKKVDRSKGPFNRSGTNQLFDGFLRTDSAFYQLSQNPRYTITKEKDGFCAKTIKITAQSQYGYAQLNGDTLSGYSIEIIFDRKSKLPLKITRKGLGVWSNFYQSIQLEHIPVAKDSLERFFSQFIFNLDYEEVKTNYSKESASNDQKEELKPLPSIELKDYTGKTVNLSDYKGKVILLDFWYSTCKPCIKAAPFVEALIEKHGKDKFVVIGMNPVDNQQGIQRYYEKRAMSYTTLLCTKKLKRKLDVQSYPSFILVNQNGEIELHKAGFSEMGMREIDQKIEHLLKE